MKINICNHRGFTLIEVIVSIIVVSIISLLAGMSFYQIAKGYVFYRDNSEMAQQAQIAMTRLKKEISSIKSVSTATATSITYKRSSDATGTPFRSISWAGGDNPLLIDANTLISPVTAFSLVYYDSYSSTAAYSSKTMMMEINLQLKGAENTPMDFVDRVNLYMETEG